MIRPSPPVTNGRMSNASLSTGTNRKQRRAAGAHLSEYDPLAWIDTLPRFVTRGDAARYAACSTRHIDRAIKAGSLETIPKGTRHVLILRDSFARWLRAGLRQSA